ncbi:MAG: hypothetical protein M3463_03170 [Verrucomicrobiota bacterium]|nr:hypothetical protein [Verrucomicrobiota bacterium]
MRLARILLIVLITCTGLGMAKKPKITVRFHVESTQQSGAPFVMPAKFKYPARDGYVERMASISERDIASIYPFQAQDGSFGCAFKLTPHGRNALEELSTVHRGRSVVAFVSTKSGVHQVIDLQIDRPILDGIITIPRGLTDLEVAALREEYATLGEGKRKKKRK